VLGFLLYGFCFRREGVGFLFYGFLCQGVGSRGFVVPPAAGATRRVSRHDIVTNTWLRVGVSGGGFRVQGLGLGLRV